MQKIQLYGEFANEHPYALVSDEDYDQVRRYKWKTFMSGRSVYAKAKTDQGTRYMHRYVKHQELAASDLAYPVVDHLNNDTLDNRRDNLKVCTQAANIQRQRLRRTNTTGHRGVTRLRNGRYRAAIGYNYKDIHLGCYATVEEAGAVWCAKARELYGDAMPDLKMISVPTPA